MCTSEIREAAGNAGLPGHLIDSLLDQAERDHLIFDSPSAKGTENRAREVVGELLRGSYYRIQMSPSERALIERAYASYLMS